MNQLESFKKWDPIENIPTRLYLHDLSDDCRCLRLEFFNYDDKGDTAGTIKVIVTFDNFYSYRNTTELSRIAMTEEVNLPDNSSLFTVGNSKYRLWLDEQSSHLTDGDPIVHYLFCTENDVIDVLTKWEPTVICQPVQKPETT